MSTNTRGRYAAPRKPRTRSTPFYLLAALAAGLLLLVGACAGDTAELDAPADFPVNAERRTGPEAEAAPEPEPVVDEPEPASEVEAGMSDEEITRLAMEITFDEASAGEMADMCDGVEVFGMDAAIAFYAEGWGPSWKSSYGPILAELLTERC